MENQTLMLLQKWAKANNTGSAQFKEVSKSLTASDYVSLQTAFDNKDYDAVTDIFYSVQAETSESFDNFNKNLHESIVPNDIYSQVLQLNEQQLRRVVSDMIPFNTQLTLNHLRSVVYEGIKRYRKMEEALTSSVTSNVNSSTSNPNDINSPESQQAQQSQPQNPQTQVQNQQQNHPNQIDMLKQLQTALQSKPNSKINISNPTNGTSSIQTVSGIDIDPNDPENTKVVASDGSAGDVNIYDLNDIDLVNEELQDFDRLAGIKK
jgi:hypothetical protein